MNSLTEKIHMQYLQEEISKMQKTIKGLDKMIDEKDPREDNEFIETLENIKSITINSIEDKKRELNELYNQKLEINNNLC